MPADVPRAGASGGQRTTTALWAPRAGNQFPDPGRLRRATEATARRRETDPPLSLRDDPDNGTCPAMPSAAGPGNGAARHRAAILPFSFGPFAYGKDRNRRNVRATQCRTPRGSACSRTFRRLTLSLDQTVQKKKFRDRQDIKETSMNTNHCAYESQHEPKNIKVQGLRGRWDVCLHAVEKNGTREYWWF